MPRSTRNQDKNGVTPISDFTSITNKKAYLYNAGSGGTQYPDFKEFSTDEIMQHLGVYILNGLSPSPQVEMKFDSQKNNPMNGSGFFSKHLDHVLDEGIKSSRHSLQSKTL